MWYGRTLPYMLRATKNDYDIQNSLCGVGSPFHV